MSEVRGVRRVKTSHPANVQNVLHILVPGFSRCWWTLLCAHISGLSSGLFYVTGRYSAVRGGTWTLTVADGAAHGGIWRLVVRLLLIRRFWVRFPGSALSDRTFRRCRGTGKDGRNRRRQLPAPPLTRSSVERLQGAQAASAETATESQRASLPASWPRPSARRRAFVSSSSNRSEHFFVHRLPC